MVSTSKVLFSIDIIFEIRHVCLDESILEKREKNSVYNTEKPSGHQFKSSESLSKLFSCSVWDLNCYQLGCL